MMADQLIKDNKANAEIYRESDKQCKEKSKQLLSELSLPKGLLPLEDIQEVGYNRSTGFVWLKQKKKKEHRFHAIGRTVSYDTLVTAFVEERRMKRLTGVKSKEFFFWVTVSDIYADDVVAGSGGKITFGTPSGLARSFPVQAFEVVADHEEDE